MVDRAFVAGRKVKFEGAEGREEVDGGKGEELEVVLGIDLNVVD